MIQLVPIGQTGMPLGVTLDLPTVVWDACSGTADLYARVGFVPPWVGYLAFEGGDCIGTCAFKGPPVAGQVEIAYHTFPAFQGRGFATMMARTLVSLAMESHPGIVVAAQTLAQESASTSILKKLGFEMARSLEHEEDGLVWEWHFPTAALG